MKINYQSDFKIIEKNLNGDISTPFRFTYFNPFKGKFIASFDGQEYVGVQPYGRWQSACRF